MTLVFFTREWKILCGHYCTLLSIISEDARYWNILETSREMWSVQVLAKNVGLQYNHRMYNYRIKKQ